MSQHLRPSNWFLGNAYRDANGSFAPFSSGQALGVMTGSGFRFPIDPISIAQMAGYAHAAKSVTIELDLTVSQEWSGSVTNEDGSSHSWDWTWNSTVSGTVHRPWGRVYNAGLGSEGDQYLRWQGWATPAVPFAGDIGSGASVVQDPLPLDKLVSNGSGPISSGTYFGMPPDADDLEPNLIYQSGNSSLSDTYIDSHGISSGSTVTTDYSGGNFTRVTSTEGESPVTDTGTYPSTATFLQMFLGNGPAYPPVYVDGDDHYPDFEVVFVDGVNGGYRTDLLPVNPITGAIAASNVNFPSAFALVTYPGKLITVQGFDEDDEEIPNPDTGNNPVPALWIASGVVATLDGMPFDLYCVKWGDYTGTYAPLDISGSITIRTSPDAFTP